MSEQQSKCPECGSTEKTVEERGEHFLVMCNNCDFGVVLHLEWLRDMTYVEKANHIGEGEREFIRSELVYKAERLRKRYNMTVRETNSFLHQMLDVSV